MDRAMETKHLAVAERNIAEGEGRVERQLALIERLRRRGDDRQSAEAFLDLLQQSLAGRKRERELILAAVKG